MPVVIKQELESGGSQTSSQGQNPSYSSQSSQSTRIVTIHQNNGGDQARTVTSKIDAIFESMVRVLTQPDEEDGEVGERILSIPYRSRNAPRQPLRALTFPGKSVMEATKFSQSQYRFQDMEAGKGTYLGIPRFPVY